PEISAEIRRLWAVPYVSSLQRHLATRSGWLPWTWAALGPAFTSGPAQAAAWRAAGGLAAPARAPGRRGAQRNAAAWGAAEGLAVPRLPPISRDTLRVWGVDDAGERAVRSV